MPLITFAGRIYKASSTIPLLDTLLSKNALVPYSCRSGFCHSCLMKTEKGKPPANSQKSLDRNKAEQGYFLACQCLPEQDMEIALIKRNKIPAVITGKKRLTPTVVALDIAPRYPVEYHCGQHVTVWASDELARSCYLASNPEQDKQLTVHIQRKANGQFSQWAHDCTQIGQKICISDIRGTNIYHKISSDTLIVVQDACFAPIISLLRKLYEADDNVNIALHLFLQVDQEVDFCGRDWIRAIQYQHAHFNFIIYPGPEGKKQLAQDLKSFDGPKQLIISGDQEFIKEYSQGLQMDILPLSYS